MSCTVTFRFDTGFDQEADEFDGLSFQQMTRLSQDKYILSISSARRNLDCDTFRQDGDVCGFALVSGFSMKTVIHIEVQIRGSGKP